MSDETVARHAVLEHLSRVLSSTPFREAERSSALLRYLANRALDDPVTRLKEYTVGVEGLGRDAGFDPRIDPIVRAEASRLRSRLARYYADEGRADPVVIELPKGTYLPRFRARAPAARSHRRSVTWVLAGSLVALGALTAGAWIARPSPRAAPLPVMQFDVRVQADGLLGSEVGTDLVLSPDGSRAAYISTDSAGVARLRVSRFDGSLPVERGGTDGARGPFWSPDGHWVGYWAGGKLRKIAVDGGSPIVLCDAPDLLGASWNSDGSIIAALDASGTLWRVPATGGPPTAIVDIAAEGAEPRWPQVLPGGRYVLYTALSGSGPDRATIEVTSLAGGRPRVLVRNGTFGRYVRPGYLTYVNQGTLYAEHFDAEKLQTRGSPVPIIDDLAYSATFGYAQLSVSESGLAAYQSTPAHGRLVATLLDSAGRVIPLVETPGRYAWPALSPDGAHLLLSAVEGGVPVVSMFPVPGPTPIHEAWSVPGYSAAVWSRDGQFLVAHGPHGLATLSAKNGTGRMLVSSPDVAIPWSFTPDDQRLAFAAMDASTAFDLRTIPLDAGQDTVRAGAATSLVRTHAFKTYPAVSPDGRWLAYASNESGSWEVYVRGFADTTEQVQVSRGGGRVPRWSRVSHRLYFSTDDRRIMVASYTAAGDRFTATIPHQWTPVRLADTGVLPNFDVGMDDRHIVALLPATRADASRSANHVTVVWNFPEELRQRVP